MRAKSLAALFCACQAVGDGFVLQAPNFIATESSRPENRANQPPTSFEAPKVGLGLGNNAGPLPWGKVVAKTQASLLRIPSSEEYAGRCRRRGACSPVHARSGETEPELNNNDDVTELNNNDDVTELNNNDDVTDPIVEEMSRMEKKARHEEDSMRLTLAVEQLRAEHSVLFPTEQGSGKIAATAVHGYTHMGWESAEWIRVEEAGAGDWSAMERHDDEGSLCGIFIEDLPEKSGKTADAARHVQDGNLSREVFLAAVDMVNRNIISHASADGQRLTGCSKSSLALADGQSAVESRSISSALAGGQHPAKPSCSNARIFVDGQQSVEPSSTSSSSSTSSISNTSTSSTTTISSGGISSESGQGNRIGTSTSTCASTSTSTSSGGGISSGADEASVDACNINVPSKKGSAGCLRAKHGHTPCLARDELVPCNGDCHWAWQDHAPDPDKAGANNDTPPNDAGQEGKAPDFRHAGKGMKNRWTTRLWPRAPRNGG